MSTGMLTDRLDRPGMTHRTLEPAQHTAARLAGFLYLFQMATGVFGFSLRGQLTVPGDAARTAANIIEAERLFRLSIAADLITYLAVIALTWALFVLLRPGSVSWYSSSSLPTTLPASR